MGLLKVTESYKMLWCLTMVFEDSMGRLHHTMLSSHNQHNQVTPWRACRSHFPRRRIEFILYLESMLDPPFAGPCWTPHSIWGIHHWTPIQFPHLIFPLSIRLAYPPSAGRTLRAPSSTTQSTAPTGRPFRASPWAAGAPAHPLGRPPSRRVWPSPCRVANRHTAQTRDVALPSRQVPQPMGKQGV